MTEVVVTGDTENHALKPFKAVLAQMQQSWNKGDAKGFATVFGDQADFVDLMGGHSVGREAITKSHAGLFAGPYAKSVVEYRIEKTKPLAPTVTVLFLSMKLVVQSDGKPVQMLARPTLTLLRGDKGWRISVYQSTRVTGVPAPAKGIAAKAAPAESEKKPAKKKA